MSVTNGTFTQLGATYKVPSGSPFKFGWERTISAATDFANVPLNSPTPTPIPAWGFKPVSVTPGLFCFSYASKISPGAGSYLIYFASTLVTGNAGVAVGFGLPAGLGRTTGGSESRTVLSTSSCSYVNTTFAIVPYLQNQGGSTGLNVLDWGVTFGKVRDGISPWFQMGQYLTTLFASTGSGFYYNWDPTMLAIGSNYPNTQVTFSGTTDRRYFTVNVAGVYCIGAWLSTSSTGFVYETNIFIGTSLPSDTTVYSFIGTTGRVVARDFSSSGGGFWGGGGNPSWCGWIPSGSLVAAFVVSSSAVTTAPVNTGGYGSYINIGQIATSASYLIEVPSKGMNFLGNDVSAFTYNFSAAQTGGVGFTQAQFSSDGKVFVPVAGFWIISCIAYGTTPLGTKVLLFNSGALSTLKMYDTSRSGVHDARVLAQEDSGMIAKTLRVTIFMDTGDYVVCGTVGNTASAGGTPGNSGISLYRVPP